MKVQTLLRPYFLHPPHQTAAGRPPLPAQTQMAFKMLWTRSQSRIQMYLKISSPHSFKLYQENLEVLIKLLAPFQDEMFGVFQLGEGRMKGPWMEFVSPF